MKFTLYYQGPLKSNQCKYIREHKHELRKCFHKQLKELWNQPPLNHFKDFLRNPTTLNNDTLIIKNKNFNFAPLISDKIYLVAKLGITLLRPEQPGSIITRGGDIDNRLKTLLDSLKVPSDPNSLPDNTLPDKEEDPFFCLLADDNLVTDLEINTYQLLEKSKNQDEVILLIHVKTTKLQSLLGGLDLP